MRRARLSLRPTALGGKGLLLFAALELAFFATSYSNLFFLLLAFCCVLGGVGLWWTVRNVLGVQAVAFDAPLAAAGATRAALVTLDGGGRPRFAIDVAIATGEGRCRIGTALRVDGPTRLHGELAPQRRGLHAVERLQVWSRFPFGLFEARLEVPTHGELVTWPAAQSGDADGAAASDEGDDGAATPLPGRGASWSGLREFRSGDSIGDVHWKATARRGAPVVKERERDAGAERTVVVDRRVEPDRLEAALAEATTAVFATAAGDAPLRLRSQGFAARLAAGQPPPTDVLRWLATAGVLPADAPPPDERTARETAGA